MYAYVTQFVCNRVDRFPYQCMDFPPKCNNFKLSIVEKAKFK